MSPPSEVVFRGTTHPPRHRIQKYWARKPANVVRELLELYSKPGDVVLDPFCGSGVTVVEALALGRRALGLDVNPAAVRLTTLLADPPSPVALEAAVRDLRSSVGRRLVEEGTLACPGCGAAARLRYRVLASVARCPECGRESALGDAEGRRRRRVVCPGCRGPLIAADTVSDRLVGVVVDCRECRPRGVLFPAEGPVPLAAAAGPSFVENPRILSHAGLRLSGLYTADAWARLERLRRRVAQLPDEVRGAVEVAFIAAAVQSSRLIPYRGNLSSGGPAWTVPGFWVPSVHLDVEPWSTFEARLRRVLAGLADCRAALPRVLRRGAEPSSVVEGAADWWVGAGDARDLSASGVASGSVDLVLTDPPYGDSVPYLEFSQLWNGWLGQEPDWAAEVGVSNAPDRGKDMAAYGRDLGRALGEAGRVLRSGGRAVVFFQNRELTAWRLLGDAASRAGLVLESLARSEAAVVSAKAQLSRTGSLTGDVVLTFRKDDGTVRKPPPSGGQWKAVARRAARGAAAAAGGEASLEELTHAVLAALWRSGMTGGEGDLGSLLGEFLSPLPGGRFRLS